MKKLLLATTVLVGTAGLASAEVSLSGSARMGVVYDDAFEGNELSFNSRARVNFSMSGETDGGLSFGASFRADNAGGANEGTSGVVFISGAFGTLTMGDTSSAAENAVGDLNEVGYTGFSSFGGVGLTAALDLDSNNVASFDGELGNEMAYIATGYNETALYEYSMGDFTGYLSVGQPDGNPTTYSIAGRYATDAFTVALGYEDREGEASQVIGSASATFSDVTVKAIYGSISGENGILDAKQYGVGAGYTMDAVSVDAFYRKTDVDGASDVNSYGIGAAYDLGGGASVEGGIARIKQDDASNTIADLGVNFQF